MEVYNNELGYWKGSFPSSWADCYNHILFTPIDEEWIPVLGYENGWHMTPASEQMRLTAVY